MLMTCMLVMLLATVTTVPEVVGPFAKVTVGAVAPFCMVTKPAALFAMVTTEVAVDFFAMVMAAVVFLAMVTALAALAFFAALMTAAWLAATRTAWDTGLA